MGRPEASLVSSKDTGGRPQAPAKLFATTSSSTSQSGTSSTTGEERCTDCCLGRSHESGKKKGHPAAGEGHSKYCDYDRALRPVINPTLHASSPAQQREFQGRSEACAPRGRTMAGRNEAGRKGKGKGMTTRPQ
eukprot:2834651-Heterocapsa_arctica.AAC.1